MSKIDFVILWVDGEDPEWRKEFRNYSSIHGVENNFRYRDWGNLQYIFRGFEKYAPWVRKVHFVTWGHVPSWLNLSCPKLNIVKHEDFIDHSYLPLFNSNAIEFNIHKIKDLSEQFVLFNDDTFLLSPLSQDRFFKNGLPRDMLVSNALSSSAGVGHFVLNNLELLNSHFKKYDSVRKNLLKWFNPKYGVDIFRTLALLPWPRFTGFVDPHQPQPFLKSTFEELWCKEKDLMERTASSRFRTCNDLNQYLFRYWQLASGKFCPVSFKDTKYISLNIHDFRNKTIEELLISTKYKMICFNDSCHLEGDEFYEAKKILCESLDKVLPNKSEFEI